MKILQLKAENVKRLVAIEIDPTGNMVVIGGNNGAGKSSVLDSIMYALGGTKAVPSKPVRSGEDKASVSVRLSGDEGKPDIIVTRTWTEGGAKSYLKVSTSDGASYSSPQAMLDSLVASLSFDPQAFATMRPADQVATLRSLTGVDFASLDAERKAVYENRRDVNRDVKSLDSQIATMPKRSAFAAEIVSVPDLMRQLADSESINRKNARVRGEAAQHGGAIADLKEQIARFTQHLAEMERERSVAVAAVAALPDDIDIDPIRDRIANAEQINTTIREQQQREQLQHRAAALTAEANAMTSRIEAIDREKHDLIASAAMPIDGLMFGADGVEFNGIPFDQASAAERLRVSIAMGAAMNPKLRVLLIRDGSLMDADNLALVYAMAEQYDCQVWIERVGDGSECSVVIEDGHIRDA